MDTLRAARADTLPQVFLDGRWVLQLSSKANGAYDSLQIAENGSHIFHYTDIVAEHDQIRSMLAARGIGSLSLLASDFGDRQTADSSKIWVLLGDPGGMYSYDDAHAYCQELYPSFSGELLKDHCMPRTLAPPS